MNNEEKNFLGAYSKNASIVAKNGGLHRLKQKSKKFQ